MYSRYRVYYFEALPITRLQALDFNHMHFGEAKTGGMPLEEFSALKNSIEKEGLINPIVIEVDSGNPPRFRIAMGNNRVEAYKQLGHDTIKALVLVKGHNKPFEGLGEFDEIQQPDLEEFMSQVHPGDVLWKKSSWANRVISSTPQYK